MMSRHNKLNLIVVLITALTIIACAGTKPEPALPVLPKVAQKQISAAVEKNDHFYDLSPALCADTEQFLITEHPVAIPVPEKAVKFNLQQFGTSSAYVQDNKSVNSAVKDAFFDIQSKFLLPDIVQQ